MTKPRGSEDKECRKCGEVKPLSAFSTGRRVCKPCRSADALEQYRAAPERQRESSVRYYHQNREAMRAAQREYYLNNRQAILTRNTSARHLTLYGQVLETPEDIIQYAKDRYRRARAEGYRSGLEVSIARSLERRGVEFQYEPITLNYVVPARTTFYKPDIVLPNGIVVELKGRWVTEDRKKLRLIKEQHPNVDLRIVFNNPHARISKTSKTTYAMVAEKIGLPWASKDIPDEWLKEPKK